MRSLVLALLRYRPLVLLALVAWLIIGAFAFLRLDIEAYPDPSPPLVEVITQNPAWSSEEMEQQVTVPIETALNGLPQLQYVRSISVFGLSDVKVYFDFGSDYFTDRQEVLNRLQLITLPNGLAPQLSPWSAVGEIYRFRMEGSGSTLNEMKAIADWLVRRELKQVPGIIDVTTFGGTTRQYQAEIDPGKLLQFNVTLPQVLNSIGASNANAGGSYLSLASQNVNVRGLGLLKTVEDMQNVVVTERNGAPVFLRDLGTVREGYQPRLGKVGVDTRPDVVEGIVLLQRGEQSLPALEGLHRKVDALNNGLLPKGMKIVPLYDRTDLIEVTTGTVRHLVLLGLVLVSVLLLAFLGDLRMSFIAVLGIPASLLFAFGLMQAIGQSANLISLGGIDFGILVDAVVITLEQIYRRLQARRPDESTFDVIARSTAESSRPVLFSVLIILVAFIPLVTMRGVPGKIFSPMSIAYGFALVGAQFFALLFAPVLASWAASHRGSGRPTLIVRLLRAAYGRSLGWALRRRGLVVAASGVLLVGGLALSPFMGGEFMPKLEEGNIWLRATLPPDSSFELASKMADEIRGIMRSYPEVSEVVSHVGRPDDGTDVSGFNNLEFLVSLKPLTQWPRSLTKDRLIEQMDDRLERIPGVNFNFSQNIQDNVEEAMSGVKGENSLKLFGDDLDVLTKKAMEMRGVMAKVAGIEDLGVFRETGQPDLMIAIDRSASSRYGVMAADVNAAVQAAIGGQAATQILEGDRRFDFVVRYRPEFRRDLEQIRDILLPTPDGGRVPLAAVANVDLREGAFMIYRENGRRYIPIKFSVRGRDLATTMTDVQARLARDVRLPDTYHYEWAGEYDSLTKEIRRLAIVIPISVLVILVLLYIALGTWTDAAVILAALPFGLIGGLFSLLVTRTPFSISAAVGFASVFGVGTLGALVFLTGIRHAQQDSGDAGEGIRAGALGEIRPVTMAFLAAALGLLPAALSSGIGAQAQQPLARVVVGGMLTMALAVPFLIPVFVSFLTTRSGRARR